MFYEKVEIKANIYYLNNNVYFFKRTILTIQTTFFKFKFKKQVSYIESFLHLFNFQLAIIDNTYIIMLDQIFAYLHTANSTTHL